MGFCFLLEKYNKITIYIQFYCWYIHEDPLLVNTTFHFVCIIRAEFQKLSMLVQLVWNLHTLLFCLEQIELRDNIIARNLWFRIEIIRDCAATDYLPKQNAQVQPYIRDELRRKSGMIFIRNQCFFSYFITSISIGFFVSNQYCFAINVNTDIPDI